MSLLKKALNNCIYVSSSVTKRMAIIYRIEGLVPTSERYQKYYWLKYIEPTSQRWFFVVKTICARSAHLES